MRSWLLATGLADRVLKLAEFRERIRASCRNAGYRLAGAPDGLPIPPTRMIFLVTISRDVGWFLHSGRICLSCICSILERNGIRAESLRAILDFGCGCGRVLRHWRLPQETRLYGTDVSREMISWCRKNLGRLGEFSTNDAFPPLRFSGKTFDLIYAVSVFTHLSETQAHSWMEEMARILKTGGVFLLSLHGQSRLPELTLEEQLEFAKGNLVIRKGGPPGGNLFGAYHPFGYVQGNLARWFEILDFVPSGAIDAGQDVYLLRKQDGDSGMLPGRRAHDGCAQDSTFR